MQPNYTPDRHVKLAEVLGITEQAMEPFLFDVWDDDGDLLAPEYILPSPDSPNGDGLWLAPLMAWLADHTWQPGIRGYIDGLRYADLRQADSTAGRGNSTTFSDALIRAALAAGVPEFVAVFGEEG